tara:strand:+ start:2342 stop:2539 length:198 start_codon:yes stop_codon:yes gene_type:complete
MDSDSTNDEVLKLRRYCFKILKDRWSKAEHNDDIYKCIDEWISKGNVVSFGIVAYFDAYYTGKCK